MHPEGDDRDPGTREAPFRTLIRALKSRRSTIELHPSTYSVGRAFVTRPVRIAATATGAVVRGSLFITADGAHLDRLTVDGGIEVARSMGIKLSRLTVRPGRREDAITFFDSTGDIEDVRVECGPETCVHVTTSTLTFRTLRLEPVPATKRGLRVSSAKVEVEDLRIAGARIAQVQAELASQVTVHRSRLTESRGSALVAIRGSMLTADGVTTASVAESAVLAQTSTVVARGCRFEASRAQTVSVSGATVKLHDSRVDAGLYGAANLKSFFRRRGQLYLRGGTIFHGDRDGILAAGSLVAATGTRFVGGPGPRRGHAISLRGRNAELRLDDVEIIAPAGMGIEIADGARGTVTGTISAPRAGGVSVESTLGVPVILDRLVVQNCVDGSAVTVLDSDDVQIRRSRFVGCAPAGVLAGRRAKVRVEDSEVQTFSKYGLAAFGGAQITVATSTVSGRPWAVFSACADNSRLVDAGGNRFDGNRGDCL